MAFRKGSNKNALGIELAEDEIEEQRLTEISLSPEFQAVSTLINLDINRDVPDILNELHKQSGAISKGNMHRPEAMLISQAHTLDRLFNALTCKALSSEQLPHYEAFMRLALKSQAQCRTTLQTLSEIKNPPVVYARQANFSNNQQINNGTHTAKNENQPNEILSLGVNHGETLDNGRASKTIGINQAMATLE